MVVSQRIRHILPGRQTLISKSLKVQPNFPATLALVMIRHADGRFVAHHGFQTPANLDLRFNFIIRIPVPPVPKTQRPDIDQLFARATPDPSPGLQGLKVVFICWVVVI
jgi:hypothetical protein